MINSTVRRSKRGEGGRGEKGEGGSPRIYIYSVVSKDLEVMMAVQTNSDAQHREVGFLGEKTWKSGSGRCLACVRMHVGQGLVS